MSQSIIFFKFVVSKILPEVSTAALDYLAEGTTIKELKAKEYFIKTEKIHREIGFVASGLVRGYLINEKGDVITTRFLKEGGFATHYKAFLNQEPSLYYFQCLEPTTFVCFDYEHIQKGYKEFPELEKFGRLVAENIIRILENRMESFHFKNAEERYLDFIKANPNLFNRVSLTHLSTYLGIARPSLSRIRKKLGSA